MVKQSNFVLHFLKIENCSSFKSDFDRPWSSKCLPIAECLCSPMRWCKCRGLCTRHNLCRTDHIEICRPRTDCWQLAACWQSFVLVFTWHCLQIFLTFNSVLFQSLRICFVYLCSNNIFLFILTWKWHWVNVETSSLFRVFLVFRVFNRDGFNFCLIAIP